MDADSLVAELAGAGIADGPVLAAIRAVPRDRFVPPEARQHAWANRPLSIGSGQTISQPLIVARMTHLAGVGPGDRVLDVGTGSGYQAAVLAQLGCEVWGIEVLPQLAERARRILVDLGYDADVATGDGWRGRPERAPFDAIVVAAAAPRVPAELRRQLRRPDGTHRGGRLVIPVETGDGQRLITVERTATGYDDRVGEAVRFVPFVGG